MRVEIKPLSVNKAWQGRRFKTDSYKAYETELLFKLPNISVPSGLLQLDVVIGYRNKLSDIDNALKPFIDILQKKYKFNDNQIYKLTIEKEITKNEFIDFELKEYIKDNE